MNADEPWRWTPLESMPEGAESWALPGQAEQEAAWADHLDALKRDAARERFMQGWLRERVRAFAIETGQIEGLYTLRYGVTEQLLARHQETVTALDLAGRRVAVPFRTKGRWKTQPNNPRRADGQVHEYCPPEQVQSGMDRFFAVYEGVRNRGYPVNVEAAWLHHRFVRTHPFQDGNGRVSRLLMAWAYLKRSLPPPVITAEGKPAYLNALEIADGGNLKALSDHIGGLLVVSMIGANQLAQQALAGRLDRPNGNGGRTIGDRYHSPPDGGGSGSA